MSRVFAFSAATDTPQLRAARRRFVTLAILGGALFGAAAGLIDVWVLA